jgi:hypothetical protein
MNRISLIIYFVLLLPVLASAQSIKFSEIDRADGRDMEFEIIGKMNDRVLIYKNVRSNHRINIYDSEMQTVETVKLDFVPDRTFNMDFVVYQDFFWMIYQYQKGRVLHCMAVKMNANAQKMTEPVEVDTTQIPVMSDNKIYTTISSEDKQKIMIFKIQARYQKFNLVTLLFDNQFNLIDKNRHVAQYNERRENYGNFLLDNDGNLVFTFDEQSGNRDNSNMLRLFTKAPKQSGLTSQEINLQEKYIDEVKLKIDNLNRRYIINAFYYKKNRGSIEGLFTCIWDRDKNAPHASRLTEFYDSLREDAKKDGMLRFAFDNFFIREVVVKRDGGFILTAEDFASDTRNNGSTWNRYDYLSNRYYTPSGYYYDRYSGYYRPYSGFANQTTRYYFENIIVMSINKDGTTEWNKVIQKSQFEDNDENYLSYSTMNSGGEIHFLFNNDRRYQVISDQSITPNGTLKRNPTLKSPQRGYEFMPKLSKQTGANQLIIPCSYRSNICFARIDF